MAMTKNVTPIADQEETPKVTNATKRSSSVGRAFNRLFTRDNAQRSSSEASTLGQETLEAPLGSPERVGRGRALPQLSLSNTPSPLGETQPRETSPHPPNYSYSNINPVQQQRESFEQNMGGYCRNPLLNMTESRAQPWPLRKPWRR
jgi:hypothetical protein